jgi:two-component system nitrogen regulation response regulator GlnG/two-component system response regulator HydG
MGTDSTLHELPDGASWLHDDVPDAPGGLGLSIAWCLADPSRVGEVALLPATGTAVLGRGRDEATVEFGRGRRRRPMDGRLLSRRQTELTVAGDVVQVANVGRCPMQIGDETRDTAQLGVGDSFELKNQLVLVLVRTGPSGSLDFPLGGADADGIVGESAAAWALSARIAFAARQANPVLVVGPSGAGKELVARALHCRSEAEGPYIARNAATIPDSLIDAELFGNARNYPNPNTPMRPGLVGAANDGTLFLDEIGEMPVAAQAHLLRVLDGGEYQRLGETNTRTSRFRFIAATNRDPSELKHDLLARLTVRIVVPGLDERPADIAVLANHLLLEAAADPILANRFFQDHRARITPALMGALLRHQWTTHVRELGVILWVALETSPGRALALTAEVRAALDLETAPPALPTDPEQLDAEAVRKALSDADNNVSAAARALGLSSRFVLYRLMKRVGVEG